MPEAVRLEGAPVDTLARDPAPPPPPAHSCDDLPGSAHLLMMSHIRDLLVVVLGGGGGGGGGGLLEQGRSGSRGEGPLAELTQFPANRKNVAQRPIQFMEVSCCQEATKQNHHHWPVQDSLT